MRYYIAQFATDDEYEILIDPRDADGNAIDPGVFLCATRQDIRTPMTLAIGTPGRVADFSFGEYEMPVIAPRVGEVLCEIAPLDIELIPARVMDAGRDVRILNVTSSFDCMDEERSEVVYWPPDIPRPRPEQPYLAVTRLMIDSAHACGAHVLRVRTWAVPLVVSETMKAALESANVTGITFTPCTA